MRYYFDDRNQILTTYKVFLLTINFYLIYIFAKKLSFSIIQLKYLYIIVRIILYAIKFYLKYKHVDIINIYLQYKISYMLSYKPSFFLFYT